MTSFQDLLNQSSHSHCDLILTPTQRMSRHLSKCYHAHMRDNNLTWGTPKIEATHIWLKRLYHENVNLTETLLSSQQQMMIWQRILNQPRRDLVLLALEAWKIIHDYEIPLVEIATYRHFSEISRFLNWAEQYKTLCCERKWVDDAQLARLFMMKFQQLTSPFPNRIFITENNKIVPSVKSLLDKFQEFGCKIETITLIKKPIAKIRTLELKNPAIELAHMTRYCVQQLQKNPAARGACIVPELATKLAEVRHQFKTTLFSSYVAKTLPSKELLSTINISLGTPLADMPIVSTLLALLDSLSVKPSMVDIMLPTLLLTNPFFNRLINHSEAYHLTLTKIRSRQQSWLSWSTVFELSSEFPELTNHIDVLRSLQTSLHTECKTHAAWRAQLITLLKALGWPGECKLDSEHFQTCTAWNQMLLTLDECDLINSSVTGIDFLQQLKSQAKNTLFQFEKTSSQIDVLGRLEIDGLDYDYIWVMGMTASAWPPKHVLNPLIPYTLQRKYQVLGSSSELIVKDAADFHVALTHHCYDLIYSYSKSVADIKCQPALFLKALPSLTMPIQCAPLAEIKLETFNDSNITKFTNNKIRNGVKILEDQVQCPLRATLIHRLGAENSPQPTIGLSPQSKGHFIHQILARIWQQFPNQVVMRQQRQSHPDWLLKQIESILPEFNNNELKKIENKRLLNIINKLLDIDLMRPNFEVIATEIEKTICISSLQFTVRLDRIDELSNHHYVIIDYKSGKAYHTDYINEIFINPQLAIYSQLVSSLDGLLLWQASLKHGVMLKGIIKDNDLIISQRTPGIKQLTASVFHKRVGDWRLQLEGLASDFKNGKAIATPNPQACLYCQLASICRKNDTTLEDAL